MPPQISERDGKIKKLDDLRKKILDLKEKYEDLRKKNHAEGLPLGDLRDLYLKAKRLRGNVFRGKLGKLFGRKLSFRGEEMDFGGKEGVEELEKIRKEYQEGLERYRKEELVELEAMLAKRLAQESITPEEANAQRQTKIRDLLSEEQKNIDERAVEGIEKNILEKMKTKWRQHGKKRLVAGLLLGVAASTGVGGAAIVGARATMGGVGTYVGVEAGLERTKRWGHQSEVMKQAKKASKAFFSRELKDYVDNLPTEDIRKEAARLKMLQVEKGLSMERVGGDRGIASLIIRRDNELTTEKAIATAESRDSALSFADILLTSLSVQINATNEVVESEVDKERKNKMVRKTVAVLAGGAVGWLIGGKLFQGTEAVVPPEVIHNVTPGENTWKIIESNLDSHSAMAGLGEASRTHMIDSLKDIFDNMDPAELVSRGFSSGDADLLYVGENIDMTGILDDPEIITKALFNAKDISESEIINIVNNNAKIATWLKDHSEELSGVFDSSVIEKVLKGTI